MKRSVCEVPVLMQGKFMNKHNCEQFVGYERFGI